MPPLAGVVVDVVASARADLRSDASPDDLKNAAFASLAGSLASGDDAAEPLPGDEVLLPGAATTMRADVTVPRGAAASALGAPPGAGGSALLPAAAAARGFAPMKTLVRAWRSPASTGASAPPALAGANLKRMFDMFLPARYCVGFTTMPPLVETISQTVRCAPLYSRGQTK